MTIKQEIYDKRKELDEARRLARVLRYDIPILTNNWNQYIKRPFFYEQIELLQQLQDLSVEIFQDQLNVLVEQCPHEHTWTSNPNGDTHCDDCGESWK